MTRATIDMNANTPTVTVLDNRGRTVRNIAYHRHPDTPDVTSERITRHQYDTRGALSRSADPRLHASGLVNFTYLTDLAGSVLRTQGGDNGTTVSLNDIAGRPFIAVSNISTAGDGTQDLSQAVTRTWQYEDVKLPGRPLSVTEQTPDGMSRTAERFVYAGNADAEQALNLAGQCVSHYDTAGLVQTNSIALTGEPLSVTRRLLKDADNPDIVADWQGGDATAWNDLLESETHTTLTTADASGAVLTTTDAKGNLQRVTYDVAGLLSGSWLTVKGGTEQVIVKSLTYSAAGQKLREEHGNGVVTTYTYEAETQRLTGIKTERPAGHAAGAKVLQDLRYDYDPVGNVLNITNDAEETRFWRNQKVVPENTYVYDSLYQLVRATGREMANAGRQGCSLPAPATPLPTDGSAYTNYTRTYIYDEAGNMTQISHRAPATNNSYTTKITVSDRSNRGVLSTLTENAAKVDVLFTAGGQQKQLQPGQSLVWTARSELLKVTPVIRDEGLNDSEGYRYDAGSQRVLKVCVQKTNISTQTQRVLYLPGLELRSTANGGATTEDLSVITVGEVGRAQVRVLHWASGKPADIGNDQVRYSYDSLTGSSGLELDGDGNIISMEEYYPYGGTSVWAARSAMEAAYKTVRYSGKEQDATGLYYYGYRYYQPWAGRWLSADPMGVVDGINLYRMVSNNPVSFYDDHGTISVPVADFATMKRPGAGEYKARDDENTRLFGDKVPTRIIGNRKKAVVSSEHTILHSTTARGLGRAGRSIKTDDAKLKLAIKKLENYGHAYQEYDDAHMQHVGSNTGRGTDYDNYSQTQAELLRSGEVSMAVQWNQTWYFNDTKALAKLTRENKFSAKTSDSFFRSVRDKNEYYFLKNNSEVEVVGVTYTNKIEMILSRLLGMLERAPSNKEFGDLLSGLGMPYPDDIFPSLGNAELANKSIFYKNEDVGNNSGTRVNSLGVIINDSWTVPNPKNVRKKAMRKQKKLDAQTAANMHH